MSQSAHALSGMMDRARLYAILDLGYVEPPRAHDVTRMMLQAGADVLQIRAKGHDLQTISMVAREVMPLCRHAGVPCIINDFAELAAELDADGLHIGQDDGCLVEARKIMGPGKWIGRSTHSLEQARVALDEGFDYIGFGPLFPTATKPGRKGIGVDDILAMEREVGSKIPAFCIGGINRANLRDIVSMGARRVVIVSDLLTAADPAAATREARAILLGTSG